MQRQRSKVRCIGVAAVLTKQQQWRVSRPTTHLWQRRHQWLVAHLEVLDPTQGLQEHQEYEVDRRHGTFRYDGPFAKQTFAMAGRIKITKT